LRIHYGLNGTCYSTRQRLRNDPESASLTDPEPDAESEQQEAIFVDCRNHSSPPGNSDCDWAYDRRRNVDTT
jgi:hypothetical protein